MNFWTINDADKNIPYIMVDQGYDVWLGNNRGSRYGKQHVTLDPTSKEFYDFDHETLATYDLPAFIDYILAATDHE